MPLKKFDPNGGSPLLEEGKAHGASSPKTRPNSPDSTKNRVILSEGSPSGKSSGTFKAPRGDGDCGDPTACGYTHLGKM